VRINELDLRSVKPIAARDRLIVALDVAAPDQARALVATLGDAVTFYKVGLELFMHPGCFELVEWLVRQGKQVFVDLKFFDVPETVRGAVRALRNRGVTFATVHGNQAILEAAGAEKGDVKILAVTVLTSLDRGDLDDLGFQCDVADLVLGERILVVTPGIRPVENRPADDQKRTVDVAQAFANGADYIVVGRPIRAAPDPRAAAQAMQATIEAIFPG
jgi:orotidine-5'-phosphate decarboxylase